MKQQTAVEWLVDELQKADYIPKDSIIMDYVIEQAKELEKLQKLNDINIGEEKAEKDYLFYLKELERQNFVFKQNILELHNNTKNVFDKFFVVIEKENKLDINSKERISINSVNMSKRVLNVLKSIEINYLDEISLWTKKELSQCRNVGTTVLVELEKIMTEYNIKFRYKL